MFSFTERPEDMSKCWSQFVPVVLLLEGPIYLLSIHFQQCLHLLNLRHPCQKKWNEIKTEGASAEGKSQLSWPLRSPIPHLQWHNLWKRLPSSHYQGAGGFGQEEDGSGGYLWPKLHIPPLYSPLVQVSFPASTCPPQPSPPPSPLLPSIYLFCQVQCWMAVKRYKLSGGVSHIQ